MAQERGIKVDEAGFEKLMDEARKKSRREKTRAWTILAANFASEQYPRSQFTGYDCLESNTRITQVVDLKYYSDLAGGAAFGAAISMGEQGAVVLDETPFYAEKGGQVWDTGTIVTASGSFQVDEVRDFNGVIVHIGRCVDGAIWPFSGGRLKLLPPVEPKTFEGIPIADLPPDLAEKCREVHADNVRMHRGQTELARISVDQTTRIPTTKNHTSTHIMNWALREVLCSADEMENPHVQQKGSLVDPEKTRFDFSHNKPLTDDELNKIESLVNDQIKADLKVYTKEVDQIKAREINTLRAVFGEKYPDTVRVVSVGADIDEMLNDPKNDKWMKHSVEFCGGTHLQSTREAEHFVLTSEEGVAKGIRRVVGISGETANEAETLGLQLLDEIKTLADSDDLGTQLSVYQQKVNDSVIPLRVRHQLRDAMSQLQKKVKEQQKQASAASGVAAMDTVANLFESAESIGGVTVVVGEIPSVEADALRGAIDWVRNKTESSAVFLVTSSDEKVTLIAGMSKTVVKNGVKAGDLIKEIAPVVGGRGGGRPDMAQGGGSDPTKISEAIDRAKSWITEKLS